jgi:hypothetical protein
MGLCPRCEPRADPNPVGASISGVAAITTIAFADGVLAADSYASDDSTVVQVVKCARLPGGDVAGGAGDLGEVAQALEWLVKGGKGDAPDIPGSCLVFTVKGVPHMASTKWPGVRCKGAVAIGSGAQGALVAMRLGKGAADAVRAVAGVDPNTGGEIDVLPVTKPVRRKK